MKNKTIETITSLVMILLLAGTICSSQAGTIEGHELDITLHPGQSRLTATDTLSYRPNGDRRAGFNMAPQVEVSQVRIDGDPADFSFRSGRLSIVLGEKADSESIELRIEYSGRFADQAPRGSPLNTEDPTYGVAATITPQGTFLGGGSGWYPDHAESRAYFRTRVRAPGETLAVTSGRLVAREMEGDHSVMTWETSYPLPSLSVAAGNYIVKEKAVGGATAYTFFYPRSQQLAETYLDAAAGYLELYQGLFGPYPFDKFAVVENFFPTGYGFPSWTLLGSSVVHLPFIVETSLGHEIAHSWWGTGVRVDYTQGNWSEGLTTYVADYLYKERESADQAREYRLKILRDYSALVTGRNEFPLSEFTRRDSKASQAIGYGKSAMVFHMARQRIGDDSFWQGLKEIATSNMFETIDWQKFARVFTMTGREPMGAFFNQWVERAGAPFLTLREVQAERSEDGDWIVEGLLQQEPPVFDLQIDLHLDAEDAKDIQTLDVSAAHTPFRFRSSSAPRRLMVDPEVHVFRRLHPVEIPPTVNGVRGSENLVAVVAGDLSAETFRSANLLLAALRQQGVDIIPEEDADSQKLAGKDVLMFGVAQKLQPLYRLPDNLQISANSFTLDGTTYTQDEAALFAGLPRPGDPERLTALFLPLSLAAAEAALRKIPHYGKYSYLIFTGGRNVAKGIWPVAQSPVIHDFDPESP